MRLELLYAEGDVMRAPENQGFDPIAIHSLLRRVEREREIPFEPIDPGQCSPTELDRRYDHAVKAAVWNHYPIRKIFGTNRSSASFFGRGVPALLVYEGDRPVQVYPHEGPSGEPVTIRQYLESLVDGGNTAEGLSHRMDELRSKIGPVGATTSELVREGRRR